MIDLLETILVHTARLWLNYVSQPVSKSLIIQWQGMQMDLSIYIHIYYGITTIHPNYTLVKITLVIVSRTTMVRLTKV